MFSEKQLISMMSDGSIMVGRHHKSPSTYIYSGQYLDNDIVEKMIAENTLESSYRYDRTIYRLNKKASQ